MSHPAAVSAAIAVFMTACSHAMPGAGPVSSLVTVHSSSQCHTRSASASLLAINDDAHWQQLWARLASGHMPAPAAPRIDFGDAFAVLVELGAKGSAGFSLSLAASSAALVGGTITLPITANVPPPGAAVAQVMTAPCLVVIVPKAGVERVRALDVTLAVPASGRR